MRIGIVHSLPLAVEALRRMLGLGGRHEVLWCASNGREALEQARVVRPDVILMDLRMPVMNGVEATRRIMTEAPCPILIITGSVSAHVAEVFEAMGAGALDVVSTPALLENPEHAGAALLAKLETMSRLVESNRGEGGGSPVPASTGPERRVPRRLIAIGSSAGGPAALAAILGALPGGLRAAIVVVQHVDARYAPPLAVWLAGQTSLPVHGVQGGEAPQEGEVLIAVKEGHLVMCENERLLYREEKASRVHTPSVDLFFESVARHWSGEACGLILTGMGRDGAAGLLALRNAGARTLAQDAATSAVYGMPRAAAESGAAAEILPLEKIAPALERWCSRTSAAPPPKS